MRLFFDHLPDLVFKKINGKWHLSVNINDAIMDLNHTGQVKTLCSKMKMPYVVRPLFFNI